MLYWSIPPTMNIIPLYNTKQLLPGLNASPEVVWVRFGRHKLFYLTFKEYINTGLLSENWNMSHKRSRKSKRLWNICIFLLQIVWRNNKKIIRIEDITKQIAISKWWLVEGQKKLYNGDLYDISNALERLKKNKTMT